MIKLPAFSIRRAGWAKEARPIFERLAFALYLAVMIGACGLIALGMIFALFLQEVRPLCVGLAGGAFARLLQQHGYRAWHFAQWDDSLEIRDAQTGFGRDPVPPEKVRELENLLRSLENGDIGGVWEVQERRQQARALLAEEPRLREVCAAELSRHPELC